ncbi:MAG: cytochrome C [Geobacter sp.]|nr:MAG: cytochrome C [Geobacter sp.]
MSRMQINQTSLKPARHLFLLALLLVMVSGCGDISRTPQEVSATGSTEKKETVTVTTVADVNKLPVRAQQRLPAPPAQAVFGMTYFDTTIGKEFIYDGKIWVPHDSTVESYYEKKAAALPKTTALIAQVDVCEDGDPSCTPTGAHGAPGLAVAGHYAFDCSVCHKVAGRLAFDKNGPAYMAGKPAPTYDASTQTCLNVACHNISGTFSYYSYDWGADAVVLTTLTYGGGVPHPSPPWYSTGPAGCSACHDDPPRNGSNGSNVWHSGKHAGQGPTGEANQCQFCHPDASSPGNGIGDTITDTALHANGSVQVRATFKSWCFGCH